MAIRCFFVQLGGYMKSRSRSGGDEVFKGSCYEPCTRKMFFQEGTCVPGELV